MKYLFIYEFLMAATLVICSHSAKGQPKYEREYVLKAAAVPTEASAFINDIFQKARIQWYGEENLNGTSIEAKLKYSGKRLSIEFSDSGRIQDVEILTSFNSLPEAVTSEVNKRLKKEFRRFRISKTQTQWTGNKQALKDALLRIDELRDQPPEGITIKYEMIIKAKKERTSAYFEVLADNTGQIQSIRQIVQRNTDNLIY